MNGPDEWRCEYGNYFVVLKGRTDLDWFVVVKLSGTDTVVNTGNIPPFVLAGDHRDAKNEVDAYMRRHFSAMRTGEWTGHRDA